MERLLQEGLRYTDATESFTRSKLYSILRDRSYLGEIPYRDQWLPGAQEALIDRTTFDRVQIILGAKVYQAHELTFGGETIVCGECGHPITGERKVKATKRGDQTYVYYRCSRYNSVGHSRTRVAEADLEAQVVGLFRRIRIQDAGQRDWFREVIRCKTNESVQQDQDRIAEINRQLTSLRQQQDRLLNLRLLDEINAETFGTKSQEFRDRISRLTLELESQDRNRAEMAELAAKVFELSQSLEDKWVEANPAAKRQLLNIVCLNCTLVGANLVPTIRKPFDVLARGLLVASSRSDRI